MRISALKIKKILLELSNWEIAQHSQRFFKTGKGEYGEGDIFLGIRVPILRKQTKLFKDIHLDEIIILLKSKYHEIRLCAIFILVAKFQEGDEIQKKKVYKLYLGHTIWINNWDLVDSSAYHIVGGYLLNRDHKTLFILADSNDIWERRISIISTFYFIKNKQFVTSLKLAEKLLNDEEDLIHKAVGWMLREVGKRNLNEAKSFLKQYYKKMPRTMLRYAIEKFSEVDRKKYLQGQI